MALALAMMAGGFGAYAAEPEFIRTAATPAFETDFTNAAEKTVNAVVCIKSFTTRQQNPYGSQGGYDPFAMSASAATPAAEAEEVGACAVGSRLGCHHI